jgi:hypothetical protein
MSQYPDNRGDGEDDLGSLGRPGSSGLGSLAQSARTKHLKQARGILLTIGVLTLLFNVILFFAAESIVRGQIQAEVRKAGPGKQFDQARLREFEETVIRENKVVAALTSVLGVVFIVLGLTVKQFPVPATAIGLVLYIGASVAFAVYDPESLGGLAIVIKIAFIVALVKSLQAAIAYQKEAAAAAAGEATV